MLTERASGILLHPTSLPGPLGAGDFGPDAYKFVDWLASAGQTYWQMLPLGEIGPGNSPYMSSSVFAGNILLIDLSELASQGWLTDEDLKPHPEFRAERINFPLLRPFRLERLRRAAKNFFIDPQTSAHEASLAAYSEFCRAEGEWLHDYALFMTLKQLNDGRDWSDWPADLADRNLEALQQLAKTHVEEVDFWKFCQWSFARQWSRLKEYAGARGIRFIGDVPIFVAHQSADVWVHRELFEMDENGRPTLVAGVPPDYFSKTGQLWGNPLYRWEEHERTGFAWWISRLQHALKFFDVVRIDHFRGFAGYWEIPAGSETAINGRWKPGPGEKFFEALKDALGQLPIIAEDLGVITPDVVELRRKFHLPGMRVLQFAFAEDENHPFLPHHYAANSVAYTGTHDNDTTLGWWNTATPGEKEFAKRYLRSEGRQIQWDMIRAISASEANTVIILMQDVLGLSSAHRMNLPGQPDNNWEWRYSWDQVLPEQTQALARITAECGRIRPTGKH